MLNVLLITAMRGNPSTFINLQGLGQQHPPYINMGGGMNPNGGKQGGAMQKQQQQQTSSQGLYVNGNTLCLVWQLVHVI